MALESGNEDAAIDLVQVECVDGVMIIRMNRPETRNALTPDLRDALGVAVSAFFADADARCLVITGVGTVFCAGGDLKNFRQRQTFEAARARMRLSHQWVGQIMSGRKPVISVVNGPAVGAGLGLAMMADLVFMADDAYLQPGFTAVGLVPDYGLGMILPRLMGPMRAKAFLFNNTRITSQEALALGLAVEVHAHNVLLEAALAQARRLAKGPTQAFGLTKALIEAGYEISVADYLEREGDAQALAFTTEDHAEGVAAFQERRAPFFVGA
ncbi:enoyl-CoA hydratase/isomerase family protein [Brevundimonas sp.]|uniref:enoyl-CoA hydratase/isomerase family protein n=1 Tax=Brevundimonas sp. TaxID=1871086 RepID=UPI0028A2DD8F|nr:enoyl-CoA hydratase/isomerase family protein [Brevundimonas sp.]